MTEYDYSPEAYDRYLHTQQRIASWVDQTEEHRTQFGSATTQSSQHGTPPMLNPRPPHERGFHFAHERRRPSFSSSSDSSSSSSTGSSNSSQGVPPRMQAFQPMYLQHPVADPLQSRHHRSDSRRHRSGDRHSPLERSSLPRSLSYVAAAPQVYGHNIRHGSSGMAAALPQLKGMSLVTSPPQSPYYQPTPSYPGKHGYPFQQTIYPHAGPAGGAFPSHPPLQARPLVKPIYSDQAVLRPPANSQYPTQGGYPGAPTVYPLSAYGPQQSTVQPPVLYQRVFKDVAARRKGSGRSRSEVRSR